MLKRESLAVAALLDSGAASVGRGRKTNVAAAAPSFLQAVPPSQRRVLRIQPHILIGESMVEQGICWILFLSGSSARSPRPPELCGLGWVGLSCWGVSLR